MRKNKHDQDIICLSGLLQSSPASLLLGSRYSQRNISAISFAAFSHRYLQILGNPILDAWRSGSACDSSNRDIHKVIRSNRVAFIDQTIHGGSILFAQRPVSLIFFWSVVCLPSCNRAFSKGSYRVIQNEPDTS
jgi:hypothetical protein